MWRSVIDDLFCTVANPQPPGAATCAAKKRAALSGGPQNHAPGRCPHPGELKRPPSTRMAEAVVTEIRAGGQVVGAVALLAIGGTAAGRDIALAVGALVAIGIVTIVVACDYFVPRGLCLGVDNGSNLRRRLTGLCSIEIRARNRHRTRSRTARCQVRDSSRSCGHDPLDHSRHVLDQKKPGRIERPTAAGWVSIIAAKKIVDRAVAGRAVTCMPHDPAAGWAIVR